MILQRRWLNSAATLAGVCLLVAGCQPQPQTQAEPEIVWHRHKDKLVSELRAMLEANWSLRGLAPEIHTLNIFDFDHTLIDNRTQVPVVNDTGLTRTIDSKCLNHAINEKPDYSIFDRENTYAYKPISATLDRLRLYSKDAQQASVVLTARSGRRTFSMIQEYLWQKGAEPDAVIAANYPRFQHELWQNMTIPDGAKKPLIIAALISLRVQNGRPVKLVRYFEDTDKYLAGAMVLLPKLYPQVRFEFYDYVREKGGGYREAFVAYATAGRLYRPDGQVFTGEDRYDSGDCPPR
jgi:hypothetical protein